MLKRLHIVDYTILSKVDIQFQSGLNVITGETGVGKSLLLDALGSLIGEKRGGIPIRSGADRAIIEAEFDVSDTHSLSSWLDDHDLPADIPVIIRREFYQNGRTRYFINDTPAPIGLARDIGDQLLDVHGQHEIDTLFNRSRQLSLLDAFHNRPDQKALYTGCLRNYNRKSARSVELKGIIDDVRAGSETFRLQKRELDQLAPTDFELKEITSEVWRLENAEKIYTISQKIEDLLNEAPESAVERIDHVLRLLPELLPFNETLHSWENELGNVRTVCIELNRTLQEFSRNVKHDPHQVEEIRLRLAALQGFQKRWGYSDLDFVEIRNVIDQKLTNLSTLEEEAAKLAEDLTSCRTELLIIGKTLSTLRKSAAERLCLQVDQRLKAISMKNARFSVQFESAADDDFREDGLDRIEFTLSPDGKIAFQPLKQVASGGEISRILLALKGALAEIDPVETLIFDEIDQGISGRVARLVGLQLAELARVHQVILVTHLPQIASLGNLHLSVRRDGEGGNTAVIPLHGEDRVLELASLLTAAGITEGAVLNAREMLASAATSNQSV
jgi:DNA repair protein RecN (Recombination protein N)